MSGSAVSVTAPQPGSDDVLYFLVTVTRVEPELPRSHAAGYARAGLLLCTGKLHIASCVQRRLAERTTRHGRVCRTPPACPPGLRARQDSSALPAAESPSPAHGGSLCPPATGEVVTQSTSGSTLASAETELQNAPCYVRTERREVCTQKTHRICIFGANIGEKHVLKKRTILRSGLRSSIKAHRASRRHLPRRPI